MHLARAVRGDHHDRRMRGLDGAELRHGHLEVGQHFQQERLEGLVGAVDLVDQQHRRPVRVGLERLQQRPLDQEALGEHVVLDALAVALAFGFGQANGDHLRAVVPLIDRGGNVEPLVALQADQPAARASGSAPWRSRSCRRRPRPRGTAAGPCLQRQIEHRRQRAVGDVVGLGQQVERGVDAVGKRCSWTFLRYPR